MTQTAAAAAAPTAARGGSRLKVTLLLLGFAVSVGIRVVAGQPQVNSSAPAGLLFAGLLGLLVVFAWKPAARVAPRQSARRALIGLLIGAAGAGVLCLPPLLNRLDGSSLHRPAGGFGTWAAVVTVVALAEEYFLRGTLFDAVLSAAVHEPTARQGASASSVVAIAVTAVSFGLLHVPLYGWTSLPLDMAVGVWLGVLRALSGTVTAPATAHVLADLAGWWLR